MNNLLHTIRKPKEETRAKKLLFSISIFLVGIALGIIAKVLDETASNLLPVFFQWLDLRNFFSSVGIWIFIAVLIAVYSKSPVQAAIHVFLFFIGMISSYYLYTVMIAGFFPKSYMMIWVGIAFISPFLAFICWYARGKGVISILVSSIILLFISRQAFVFGYWYFAIRNSLELLLWIATIVVLYQSPRQIIKVIAIGVFLFFVTAPIRLFWGIL